MGNRSPLALVVGLVASSFMLSCSAPPESVATEAVPTSPATAGEGAAPSGRIYFEGEFDVASNTMKVTPRAPGGGLAAQATLPYGNSPGGVYFHTCPTPTYSTATHTLTGSVQAVNLAGVTITNLTAVVDSVAPTGATPASGVIATYGTVAPNSPDCSSSLTWTFTNPSDGNFKFFGHADGDMPGYNKYRLRVTSVLNPGAANSCQLSELTLRDSIGVDRATGGSVFARTDEGSPASPTNEEKDKAFDKTTNTKYLDFNQATYIGYTFPGGNRYVVKSYTVASANDSPERDPAAWVLEASNDGSSWTTIDTRSGQTFAARFTVNSYTVP